MEFQGGIPRWNSTLEWSGFLDTAGFLALISVQPGKTVLKGKYHAGAVVKREGDLEMFAVTLFLINIVLLSC